MNTTIRFCWPGILAELLVTAMFTSVLVGAEPAQIPDRASRLARIRYNNPGAITDLGVGLWAWPIPCGDRNGDGLPDLMVACGGVPSHGTYYFENTGKREPGTGAEIFKTPQRIGEGNTDLTPSYLPDGSIRVLGPGCEYPGFLESGMGEKIALPIDPRSIHPVSGAVRGHQWSYVDFDGDGRRDLVVGLYDYSDYGWEDAYDENGRWTNGPLHGFVFLLQNEGSNQQPKYAPARKIEADLRPIDVYGAPSPVFADFLGTGKLDLLCGEFVDGFTFFRNIGTRTEPRYAAGRRLRHEGKPITTPLCMIVVVAYDWNRDGRPDLIVGQEDGRVAWLENTGKQENGIPQFLPPRFFRQEATEVKYGTLSIPVAFDWDGDGLTDILSGNTAGEIGFIKNLGGNPPKFAPPVTLQAGGKPLRVMAGYNLSVQGPCEAKFGYTNPGVGDWDGDGLPDLLINTIVGKILWFKNIGTRTQPRLAEGQPLQVAWDGPAPKPAWNWWDPAPGELVVQWRCTPCVIDLDKDGIADLVTPDHEGYLAFYQQVLRNNQRVLLPGRRIFRGQALPCPDGLLRLNNRKAGASGRRTFCFADWDGDGKLDLLLNGVNADFFRNVSSRSGEWEFKNMGPVDGLRLAGHNSAPTTVDWDGNSIPDLLIGAEDGFFYYLGNPRSS